MRSGIDYFPSDWMSGFCYTSFVSVKLERTKKDYTSREKAFYVAMLIKVGTLSK